MSRHRNVRHLIAEDYDDYDDDYYDDDGYDDYDYKPAAPKAASTNKGKHPATAKKTTVPAPRKNVAVSFASSSSSSKAGGGFISVIKAPSTTSAAAGGGTSVLTAKTAGATSPATTTPPLPTILPPTKKPPPSTSATTSPVILPPTQPPTNRPPAPPSSTSTTATSSSQQHQQSRQSATSTGGGSVRPKRGPPVPDILLNQSPNQKQNLTLVILGHVDAGKSTVTGHLLYTTAGGGRHGGGNTSLYGGNRQPINFAWLLDEDEQERVHGITMDIATKTIQTPRWNVVLQDAPGHADFVPCAITGTAHAQAALLVVDATDYRTALNSGQFKQHAYLARGLGVIQILVVINKMDLVQWQQSTYDEINQSATQFLVHTVGYPANAIRCVPVSGLTGANITKTSNNDNGDNDEDIATLQKWYKNGPTLIEAIDGFFDKQRDGGVLLKSDAGLLEKPLRLVLTDVVGDSGKANRTSVRAKVLQGWVKTGERVIIMPLADEATIQKLSSLHSSTSTNGANGSESTGTSTEDRNDYAGVGEMLDLVLAGVDTSRVLVGNTLCRPNAKPPIASRCRAKIWVLEGLTIPIIRGAQAIFYMHHLNIPCHLSQLLRTLQKDNKTVLKERPRAIGANTQAVVEITLSSPIVMEAFEDCKALGRFVLRRGGDSIAVGRIEQIIIQ